MTKLKRMGDSGSHCLIPMWFIKEVGEPSTNTEKETVDMDLDIFPLRWDGVAYGRKFKQYHPSVVLFLTKVYFYSFTLLLYIILDLSGYSLANLSTTSMKILNWSSLLIATLCLDIPSGSTHSPIDFAVTGISRYNICNTYFFANGGNDLR